MKIKLNQEYDKQVPNLSQQEYDSLIQSIREYGQLSPILVNQDGIVLDGHHRFRICQELGMEPQYKTMVFKDKVEERLFVSTSNLEGKGRHLNNFRRTELALKSKPDLKEIAKRRILAGKTLTRNQERVHVDKEIARMANVSHDTVKKVEKIAKSLEEDDLEKLRSEEVSINQAYNRILDHERLEEIHTAIEPLRPQIEGIIKEWEDLCEGSLGQIMRLYKTGPDTVSFAQQKEDIRNRFEKFGIRQYFIELLSGVFDKLIANRQLDPKKEMSKVLELIQSIKRTLAEEEMKKGNSSLMH